MSKQVPDRQLRNSNSFLSFRTNFRFVYRQCAFEEQEELVSTQSKDQPGVARHDPLFVLLRRATVHRTRLRTATAGKARKK